MYRSIFPCFVLAKHYFLRLFALEIFSDSGQLADLLRFVTGLESVPPMGFDPELQITFCRRDRLSNGDATLDFPVANTCSNTLRLPVVSSYETFSTNITAAIMMATTFSAE